MQERIIPPVLSFDQHGAERFPAAAIGSLEDVRLALSHFPSDQAGIRIYGVDPLARLLMPDKPVGAIAAKVLGKGCRAVRAILFDKTTVTNWSLPWHQDRTICVRKRLDIEGFGPWTEKAGMLHVEPPFEILAGMVTLRLHLDDVSAANAPLVISPRSHLEGRVSIDGYDDVIRRCGSYTCLANAGDIWLYATPILHSSEAATMPRHRRVLQIDYSADQLPGGLEWLGI